MHGIIAFLFISGYETHINIITAEFLASFPKLKAFCQEIQMQDRFVFEDASWGDEAMLYLHHTQPRLFRPVVLTYF